MHRKRQSDVVYAPVMRSAPMRELDRVLRAVADKDVTVTLIGESGSGKEILARRLHELSGRHRGPFIPINCAAIPDALFESELFGHEKGAFTGASERAKGKLEASHGGTLFLDEIGEMPFGVQAKLLRFLDNRKFMRVGGAEKITIDARLVCATLRPLDDEVKAGRFRADLYYRIQGITLRVPPLRERRADILPLVQLFQHQFAAKHATATVKLTRGVTAALRAYSWPGNVRELRNVVELVTLLRAGKRIRLRDLPESFKQAVAPPEPDRPAEEGAAISISLADPLERSIRRIMDAALALERGNRSKAAQRLGVSLRTVQRYVARS